MKKTLLSGLVLATTVAVCSAATPAIPAYVKAAIANPARAAFFADCDAFVAVVAEAYFELCVAAIKAADPNHLVIGSRFGYQPHPNVIAAAGRYLDVISFNHYDFDPGSVIGSDSHLMNFSAELAVLQRGNQRHASRYSNFVAYTDWVGYRERK